LQERELVWRATRLLFDQTPEALAEASELAEAVIRMNPTNAYAHNVRANVFLLRMAYGEIPHNPSNVAQALNLAQTAVRLGPENEYAHFLMGWAYQEDGQLEAAVAEYERGLEINPNCWTILADLGGVLAALGRPEEAIETCKLPYDSIREIH